jgi:transcriptional/translational regulatory protein YebC/TACO1
MKNDSAIRSVTARRIQKSLEELGTNLKKSGHTQYAFPKNGNALFNSFTF